MNAANPTTAREVLDYVNRFLESQTLQEAHGGFLLKEEGRKLLDILSALRGPDQEEVYHLKPVFTAYIRRKAFPAIGGWHWAVSDVVPGLASWEYYADRYNAHHYMAHIHGAMRALGDW